MKCSNLMVKIICGAAVLFFLSYQAFSYVYLNGAGSGYEGTPGPGIQAVEDQSIEMYIVAGAGYYYAAISDIDSLLRLYELQDRYGATLPLLQGPVDRAIFNLNYAIYTYEKLIQKAENTPYNQAVLEQLAAFDYESYRVENGLNRDWYNAVADYLKNGQITGMFKKSFTLFKEISERLTEIKMELSQQRLPAIERMWRLNELSLEASYLGSCSARIFRVIKYTK